MFGHVNTVVGWREASDIRSLLIDPDQMMPVSGFPYFRLRTLSSLHCFDSVGLLSGRASGLIISEGFLLKQ